jgi:hypothetical protein
MIKELIPLQPEQHPVTRLPKVTTDLPFFYLTKQKDQLSKPIIFEAYDERGKPLKWKVTPNTIIGAPGIEAHEVWVRLIKPAIDERRQADGYLPAIIPLGKVRECLRTLGWNVGGWEARRLFSRIDQIIGAICEADFFIQILGTDNYTRIKAKFARMSLYAVGATHLSQREIEQGVNDFDFELEDTVYIQLHSVEQEIQQNEKQRYVDNEYLFSVSPSARRWYELLAPKFYGVTKNAKKMKSSPFCEIRYSWYLQRHHTLKRETERYKVAKQMDKLIKDHLKFGYVLKAEYYQAPDDKNDFVIRYFPGPEATTSAKRVLAHLNNQNNPKSVQLPLFFGNDDGIPLPKTPPQKAAPKPTPTIQPKQKPEDRAAIEKLMGLGIDEARATQLVEADRGECELWAEAWPYQNQKRMDNPAAVLISFIEKKRRPLPKGYSDAKKFEAKQKEQELEAQRRFAEDCYFDFFAPQFRAFLREEFTQLQAENAEAFNTFAMWLEKNHGRGLRMVSEEETRERITLQRAWEFFGSIRPELGVRMTSFEEWDKQHNTERVEPLEWLAKNPDVFENLYQH